MAHHSNKIEKYAYLDKLGTEWLKEILRLDIDSPENSCHEASLHILEELERREKENSPNRLLDVDQAWAEFQQHYNTPEGENLSLYPCGDIPEDFSPAAIPYLPGQKRKRAYPSSPLRRIVIIAAVLAALFALAITAQASGLDVWGRLARWTDETFNFITPAKETPPENAGAVPASRNKGHHDMLQAALNDLGMDDQLAPTWYPDGFKAFKPKTYSDDMGESVNCYFENVDGSFFSVDISRYKSSSFINSYIFEKDDTPVEQYTSGSKTFYIMSNMDTMTSTWANEHYMITIAGNIPVSEIKSIIDSIGGN